MAIFLAIWLRWAVVGVYFCLIILKYLLPSRVKTSWMQLHLGFLGGLLLWIVSIAVGQYLFWMQDATTAVFATSALPAAVHLTGLSILFAPFRDLPHAYLAYTVFSKYLAPLIWQLGVIFLCALVLRVVREKRTSMMTDEEVNLLYAAMLLSAWPGVVVIVPLFFLALLGSVFINTLQGRVRTPAGFAAAFALLAAIPVSLESVGILWILTN